MLTEKQFQDECKTVLYGLLGPEVDMFFDGVKGRWVGCSFETDDFSGEITYYLLGEFPTTEVGKFRFEIDGPYQDFCGKSLKDTALKCFKAYKKVLEAELKSTIKLIRRLEKIL